MKVTINIDDLAQVLIEMGFARSDTQRQIDALSNPHRDNPANARLEVREKNASLSDDCASADLDEASADANADAAGAN